MIEQLRQRFRIMNILIDHISYTAAINRVIQYAIQRTKGFCCFVNAHMCIEARDASFAEMVNGSLLSVSDGMSIVFSLKFLYGIKQDRIAGMDTIESILKKADEENLRLFIVGGGPATISSFSRKIRNEFPHVMLAGHIDPPMGDISTYDNERYIEEINDSGAHIVFVCLGCPKQEKWMSMFSPRINSVLLGLGGALAVFTGNIRRSPGWMQRSGLEWLYRLTREPKRLWKRYLITNSLFVRGIIAQKVKS